MWFKRRNICLLVWKVKEVREQMRRKTLGKIKGEWNIDGRKTLYCLLLLLCACACVSSLCRSTHKPPDVLQLQYSCSWIKALPLTRVLTKHLSRETNFDRPAVCMCVCVCGSTCINCVCVALSVHFCVIVCQPNKLVSRHPCWGTSPDMTAHLP